MGTNIRILIVDDDVDLLETICSELNQQNFEVLSAACGEEALPLVTKNHFDVIFSDISMPHGDGLWLLTKVKELKPQIPFIFVTGNAETSEEDMKKRGAFALLQKPASAAMYGELIQAALKKP